MGKTTGIEWTDATWNPWQGCTKVSPACAHCYMFRDMKRFGKNPTEVRRSKPPTFNLPLAKSADGQFKIPGGSKVFTCSWSDWFHEAADAWREEAWEIVRRRPDLTFQIVTKRIDRAAKRLPADWGNGYANVWLIVTAENQGWLEKRVHHLLDIPAVVRGLSIEPLLGPIRMSNLNSPRCRNGSTVDPLTGGGLRVMYDGGAGVIARSERRLHWVIVGGESGPESRPMHPDWVRSIRDQCHSADVPFFFKQWGEWVTEVQSPDDIVLPATAKLPWKRDDTSVFRVGTKAGGRVLDGREWSEFPSGVEL